MLGEHPGRVADLLARRERVEVTAERLEARGDRARVARGRALEHHVLDEVRDPELLGRFVARAGAKPNAECQRAPVGHRLGQDGEPVREPIDVSPGTAVLISVPPDFQAVKRASPELALRWRMESRAAFEAALTAGLVAVDFRRDGTYVMALAPGGGARVET